MKRPIKDETFGIIMTLKDIIVQNSGAKKSDIYSMIKMRTGIGQEVFEKMLDILRESWSIEEKDDRIYWTFDIIMDIVKKTGDVVILSSGRA